MPEYAIMQIKKVESKNMIITKQAIEKIVGNKFFYISYFKKDGTYREMNSARLNVSKHLKGGQNKNPNINKTQIIVFDNNKSGYRTINIEKIIEIRCGDCKIIDSEYKATLDQDKAYTKELDMENFILETLLKNKKTESEVVNGTRSIRISKKQKH